MRDASNLLIEDMEFLQNRLSFPLNKSTVTHVQTQQLLHRYLDEIANSLFLDLIASDIKMMQAIPLTLNEVLQPIRSNVIPGDIDARKTRPL